MTKYININANPKFYLLYGGTHETEPEPLTKVYIGKEKDKENNPGDYGVRKFDSKSRLFTS